MPQPFELSNPVFNQLKDIWLNLFRFLDETTFQSFALANKDTYKIYSRLIKPIIFFSDMKI